MPGETMTFKVFQFWNGNEASIREVEIPGPVYEEKLANILTHDTEGVRMGLLNSIFHYGQNETQNKPNPSVSVGDIIQLNFEGDIEFWVVASQGFKNYGRDKHFIRY